MAMKLIKSIQQGIRVCPRCGALMRVGCEARDAQKSSRWPL
jgi:hypothetical protein